MYGCCGDGVAEYEPGGLARGDGRGGRVIHLGGRDGAGVDHDAAGRPAVWG